MSLDLDEQGLVRRVELLNTRGEKAIVLVKKRETPTSPFEKGQMGLALPDGTEVQALENLKN